MGYPSFPHYALRRAREARQHRRRKPLSLVTSLGLWLAVLATVTTFILAFG